MHARMSLVRNSGVPAFGRSTIRGETGSGRGKVSPDADRDGKSGRPILVKKQKNKSMIEHKDRQRFSMSPLSSSAQRGATSQVVLQHTLGRERAAKE
jgi:hypothetical protein